MSNSSSEQQKQKEYSISVAGFIVQTSDGEDLRILLQDGNEVTDIDTRTSAILEVSNAFPLFAKAFKSEANKRQKEINAITQISGKASALFADLNEYQELVVGKSRDRFGNIYVFHSKTTGEPFFMAPRHFGEMSLKKAKEFQVTLKCEYGRGSQQVTLEQIQNPELDDGGLRLLTLEEGDQLFELPSEVKVLLGFEENKCFLLASKARRGFGHVQTFNGEQRLVHQDDDYTVFHCGRSLPRQKLSS